MKGLKGLKDGDKEKQNETENETDHPDFRDQHELGMYFQVLFKIILRHGALLAQEMGQHLCANTLPFPIGMDRYVGYVEGIFVDFVNDESDDSTIINSNQPDSVPGPKADQEVFFGKPFSTW